MTSLTRPVEGADSAPEVYLKYLRKVLPHYSQSFRTSKYILRASFKPKISEICWQFLELQTSKGGSSQAVGRSPGATVEGGTTFDLTLDLDT